jgi:hypothetical protein
LNQIGDLAVGKARVFESRMQEEKSMSLARLRGDSEGILREGALHGGKDICGVVSYIEELDCLFLGQRIVGGKYVPLLNHAVWLADDEERLFL